MRNLKKFLALVLAMMMVLSMTVTVSAADISDSDDISAKYLRAVNVMLELGVFQGDDNGELRPRENLSRQEFAVLLYRIKTGDTTDVRENGTPAIIQAYAEADSYFTDVSADNSYRGYINYAFEEGLMKGDLDLKLFRPTATVSGYEILVTYLRVLGYDQRGEYTGNTAWKSNVRIDALTVGITDGSEPNLDNPASREFMGQLSYNQVMFATVAHFNPVMNQYDKISDGSEKTWGQVAFNLKPAGSVGSDEYGRDLGTEWTTNVNGEVHSFTAPNLTLVATLDSKHKTMPSGYKECSTAQAFVDGQRDDTTLGNVIKNTSGTGNKGINSKVWLEGKGVDSSAGTLAPADANNASSGSLITYLTANDNWTTEVYANGENEIVRIVVLKTSTAVLKTSDIHAATSSKDAYVNLGGKEYLCQEGDAFAKNDVVTYVTGYNQDTGKAVALDAEVIEPMVATATRKSGDGDSATYTIGGAAYTVSKAATNKTAMHAALGASIDDEEDCNVYLLPMSGKLIYAAAIESGSSSGEMDETGFILVTAHSDWEKIGDGGFDNKNSKSNFGATVRGILSNGEYDRYSAVSKDGFGNANDNRGLYSYTLDSEGRLVLELVVTGSDITKLPNVTTGSVIKSTSTTVTVTSGQVENEKAILTNKTVFVYYQLNSSNNNWTVKSVTPIFGVKSVTKEITLGQIIGVNEDGEAVVVYVNDTYKDPASSSGVMVYLTNNGKTIKIAGGNDGYEYTAVDSLGNEIESLVIEGSTQYSAGQIFELNDDGSVGEEVTGDVVIRGAVSKVGEDEDYIEISASDVVNITDDSNIVYLDGVDEEYLTKGLNVVVVKTDKDENDVDAMWADAIKYVEVTGEVTPSGADVSSGAAIESVVAENEDYGLIVGMGVEQTVTITVASEGNLAEGTWSAIVTASGSNVVVKANPKSVVVGAKTQKVEFVVTLKNVTGTDKVHLLVKVTCVGK